MRFNSYLQAVANAYREEFYGSTDERDSVQRPHDWTEEKVNSNFHFSNGMLILYNFSLIEKRWAENIFVFTCDGQTLSMVEKLNFRLSAVRRIKLKGRLLNWDCTESTCRATVQARSSMI